MSIAGAVGAYLGGFIFYYIVFWLWTAGILKATGKSKAEYNYKLGLGRKTYYLLHALALANGLIYFVY